MNSTITLCLVLLLSGALFGCSSTNGLPRQYVVTYGDGESPDTLSFSKPSRETLQQIKVQRVSLTKEELRKLAALPKESTYGVRWFVEQKPNTMLNGPWNTQIYIFETGDTNHCVRLDLLDNHGRIDHKWLNDKLLFVEVWFGRIAWTDFILDTKTLNFLHMEDGRLDRMLAGPVK